MLNKTTTITIITVVVIIIVVVVVVVIIIIIIIIVVVVVVVVVVVIIIITTTTIIIIIIVVVVVVVVVIIIITTTIIIIIISSSSNNSALQPNIREIRSNWAYWADGLWPSSNDAVVTLAQKAPAALLGVTYTPLAWTSQFDRRGWGAFYRGPDFLFRVDLSLLSSWWLPSSP